MKKALALVILFATVALGSILAAQQTAAPAAPPAPRARVDVASSLPLQEARIIIEAAVAYVRKDNGRAAIVVVDDNGNIVSMDRMDGTGGFYERFAVGKAVGAVALQVPTSDMTDQYKTNPQRFFSMLSQLHGEIQLIPGGFPLVVEGRLLGGVGSAGHGGQGDVEAAKTGIAAWERFRQSRRQ